MDRDNLFVSVLMSVYSEKPSILEECINSILEQTFRNFEFLIYLDKPDNEELWSYLVKKACQDSRIIIHRNEKNRNLAGTLNDELSVAKGDYIVRMDGDDSSAKERIAELVDYMENHPEIGVASSWMKEFGNKEPWKNKVVKYTSNYSEMELMILYQTPIAHAPCIFRKSVIENYSPIYNEKCCRTQDYDAWSRLIRNGVQFGMVRKPLYLRRKSGDYGPKPIQFRVIHNQIARNNVGCELSKYNIKLPDIVNDSLLHKVHEIYKNEKGQNRKKMKTIAAIIYSTLYNNPLKMIAELLKNRDLEVPLVLPFNMMLHFLLSCSLCDINNKVTDKSQLIY